MMHTGHARWSGTQVAALAMFLALGLTGRPAGAMVEAQVRRESGQFHVTVALAVAADARTVWSVLTDYDHYAQIVPDMRESRVVSAGGEPLRVSQKGEWRFLFLRFPVDVVLEMDEQPYQRIAFRRVSGTIAEMAGETLLEVDGQGVRIRYAARITPGFWVPPLIGTELLRRDLTRKFEALASEILRRAAAPGQPQS